ncbi:hypothetical protein V1505DRAFT_359337 [Lipomyces doorenjongii]
MASEDIAKGVIIEHVNDLLMLTLNSYARAYDMFDSISQRHRASAKQREAYLLDEPYSKKMSDDDSLTNEIFLQALYKSLAPKFLEHKTSLKNRQLPLNEAISALILYDEESAKERSITPATYVTESFARRVDPRRENFRRRSN